MSCRPLIFATAIAFIFLGCGSSEPQDSELAATTVPVAPSTKRWWLFEDGRGQNLIEWRTPFAPAGTHPGYFYVPANTSSQADVASRFNFIYVSRGVHAADGAPPTSPPSFSVEGDRTGSLEQRGPIFTWDVEPNYVGSYDVDMFGLVGSLADYPAEEWDIQLKTVLNIAIDAPGLPSEALRRLRTPIGEVQLVCLRPGVNPLIPATIDPIKMQVLDPGFDVTDASMRQFSVNIELTRSEAQSCLQYSLAVRVLLYEGVAGPKRVRLNSGEEVSGVLDPTIQFMGVRIERSFGVE
jgi:hypothetical protein